MRQSRGFSLVEMLMVLATTSLLMALLHPGLSYARRVAREVVCAQSQHEVTIALLNYSSSNNDRLPGLVQLGSQSQLFNSNRSYADVLVEEGLLTTPRIFVCPVEDAGASGNLNPIQFGLNRYMVQNRGAFNEITDQDWCPPHWTDRGVVASNYGPRLNRIALPSSKLFMTDSVNGAADTSLTADKGLALVRHQNYGANYSFIDGHSQRYSFQDMYGANYDPTLAPTEATSSTVLENLRNAGMVGGVEAKSWGEHYTSAETFSPWAPWGEGNAEAGGTDLGWGTGSGSGSDSDTGAADAGSDEGSDSADAGSDEGSDSADAGSDEGSDSDSADAGSDEGSDSADADSDEGSGSADAGSDEGSGSADAGSGHDNNGHGNNDDGVDSSNPGTGGGGPTGSEDPSGTVDDEGHGGGSSSSGGSADSGSSDDGAADSGSADSGSADAGSGHDNNGHGNNDDGVDVSNPGNGGGGPTGAEDPSGTVDDESGPGGGSATDEVAGDSGSADSGSADSGSSDDGSADSGSADSGSSDDDAADSGSADDGSGHSNNGHGNNDDGVDVSNPGNGGGGPNGEVDPSGTVDDEGHGGGSSSSKKNK